MGIWGEWSFDLRKRRSSIRLSETERMRLEDRLVVVTERVWMGKCTSVILAVVVTVIAAAVGAKHLDIFAAADLPFSLNTNSRTPMPPLAGHSAGPWITISATNAGVQAQEVHSTLLFSSNQVCPPHSLCAPGSV